MEVIGRKEVHSMGVRVRVVGSDFYSLYVLSVNSMGIVLRNGVTILQVVFLLGLQWGRE